MIWAVDEGRAGISNDRKRIDDVILIVFVPLTVLFPMRPKVDFLFTIPITVLVGCLTFNAALTEDDGNMACFVNPELYMQSKLFRWSIVQIVLIFAWYYN